MNYYIAKVFDDAGNLTMPVVLFSEKAEDMLPKLRTLYGEKARFEFILQEAQSGLVNFGQMKPNSISVQTTWVWSKDHELPYRPL